MVCFRKMSCKNPAASSELSKWQFSDGCLVKSQKHETGVLTWLSPSTSDKAHFLVTVFAATRCRLQLAPHIVPNTHSATAATFPPFGLF